MSDEIREELFNAFVAGFMVSGEGGNAEYPHYYDKDEIRDEMRSHFHDWLEGREKPLTPELRELVEQWREDAENMRTGLGEDPNEDQFKWGYQSAIVNKANELEEVLDG